MSDYPVGAALMALPFYVPSVVSGVSPSSRIFSDLEKVSAATIVALSALLLYLAAARVTANWMAMLLTAHLCIRHHQSQRKQPGAMAAWSRAARTRSGDLLPGARAR